MRANVESSESFRSLKHRSEDAVRSVIRKWVKSPVQRMRARFLSRDLARDAVFKQSSEDAGAGEAISIVVPIHDAPAAARRCMASLEKYATLAEIILVDDGSVLAETHAIIREFHGRRGWQSARHDPALGHSRACEAGARLATRPYLCLLNSDTVVTPWCWRIVKEAFEAYAQIGIAGPSTSLSGHRYQDTPLAKYCREYWNENQINGFALSTMNDQSEPSIMDLPWVAGFALFIRRNLWEELGGFDQNLPDYGNEVDLCRRAVDKGNRVVWLRRAYIHHLGLQSYERRIGKRAIFSRLQAAERYLARKHPSWKAD